MKTIPGLMLVAACWIGMNEFARAHPVAQGALEVRISAEAIHVRARVSGEEVFVANTFAASATPKPATIADVWQRHGDYLLRHLKVFADGHVLAGHVLSVASSTNDFVLYQIEFPVGALPSRVRLEENLLNEIEFAPGNPWEAAFVVRVQQHGEVQDGLLLSRRQPLNIECVETRAPASLDQGRMARQYIRHGIGHILSGYDHLLFVAALVLGAATFWDLVKVVSVFTLAHTVTLTLSVLNIVRLPSQVVEPMIAASIVFVAASNFLWLKPSRGRVRLATAFFFGLFHGLGFAGGLLSATEGMSGFALGLAITAFSVGVELGHQTVVLPLFFALKTTRAVQTGAVGGERRSLAILRAGSLLIAAAGFVYLVAALK